MSAPFDRSLTGAVDGGLGQDAGISPLAGDEERVVESALRPHSLTEFIGQPKVSRQLALVLEGAKRRGRPPDHVLLSGPPGLGKTSLALIIGSELGTSVKITCTHATPGLSATVTSAPGRNPTGPREIGGPACSPRSALAAMSVSAALRLTAMSLRVWLYCSRLLASSVM